MIYVRHLLKRALLMPRGYRLIRLGEKSTGCSWTLCPDGLGPNSVVYSGGVGKDITFEHSLVEQFGCTALLFDPSPTGIATMALPENKISKFKFKPLGLAGSAGTLRLAPPLYPEEGSWYTNDSKTATIEAKCLDLATLLEQNGHRHVDLLKLDIEGSEYGVIDHILGRHIPVRQILVEFHHGLLPGIRTRQSVRALCRLLLNGYVLLAETGTTQTFWRKKWRL